jgi:undecaprenyl-diphosphatase
MSHLTYAQAVVTGLIQGVTELFPVSSLGHNVLLPALIGGQWAKDLSVSAKGSPYLAFIVGLHVATALAMILYFWRDWVRIVRGFFSSLRRREIVTADQRLAWMIVLATIPVGIAGALLQKVFINVFARPELTALFLAANGLILLYSERQRRTRAARGSGARAAEPVAAAGPAPGGYQGYPQGGYSQGGYSQQPQQQQWQGPWHERGQEPDPGQNPWGGEAARPGSGAPGDRAAWQAAAHHGHRADPRANQTEAAVAADRRLSVMGYGKAILVGSAQILALLPGISRDGIVTVAGMGRGLNREDAVRFSFLLSAPVILAAGLLKAHDLLGPAGKGIHGPVLVGSVLSFVGAYLSVRFLTRYFSESRSLNPFGIYCLVAGLLSFAYLLIK